MGVRALSSQLQGHWPPVAHGAVVDFAKRPQHMFVWIFSRILQFCFKYLTLDLGCLRLPEVIPVIFKREEI